MENILLNIFSIFGAVRRHHEVLKKIEDLKEKRVEIDSRLLALEQATLDNEEEWFLKVVKKHPSCAIRVIKECDQKT